MSRVFVAGAKRSAVIPRGGAFKHLQADEIAAPVIDAVLKEAGLPKDAVQQVIMGNALYAGGNPARLAALRAGLPEHIPAITIDTQCCSGMDALHHGAALIKSGMASAVVVGGMESYSRSPIRMKRPLDDEAPVAYDRPAFTPWADRDPDMLVSAAGLSQSENVTREMQEVYAAQSHQNALMAAKSEQPEIVTIEGQCKDAFTRKMSPRFLGRLTSICGQAPYDLTAATVAVEADAAAALLLIGEEIAEKVPTVLAEYISSISLGTDPEKPALSPLAAIEALLQRSGKQKTDVDVFEVMEAFALQGVLTQRYLGPDLYSRLNRSGGALARGHPIGASGAINLVRLTSELMKTDVGALGIAAIAAAGGLGSAALFAKSESRN